MKTRLHWLVVASVLMGLAAMLSAAEGDGSEPVSPDTERILAAIDRSAPHRTAADRRAAEELNQEGDRAYHKFDYRTAFTAYSNSYPNFATAHAYILAGDSHWRDVLQFAQSNASRPVEAAGGPPTCAIGNQHFSHDLLMDVQQHYDVGLALAARANRGRLPIGQFLQRARESANCLRGLAGRYEAQPPTACVDLAALRKCLGAPFLR
jgi:hypothetical protein